MMVVVMKENNGEGREGERRKKTEIVRGRAGGAGPLALCGWRTTIKGESPTTEQLRQTASMEPS